MLVLTRKPNERIRITVPPNSDAREIIITTMKTSPCRTKVGIIASDDVRVVRDELSDEH